MPSETVPPDIELNFYPNGAPLRGSLRLTIGDDSHIDQINLARHKDREGFTEAAVQRFPAISREQLLRNLDALADERLRRLDEPASCDKKPQGDGVPEHLQKQALERLRSKSLVSDLLADFARIGIAGEETLALSVYLVGTSRLLDRPLAAIVQGPSSSGKSYVVGRVASLFPQNAVLVATQLTPNALFYLDEGALEHRFIVCGEREHGESDDHADTRRALREMISEGKLTKLVPEKQDGRQHTVLVEQNGPIAYCETTTQTRIFDEDANRCLLLTTDERSRQTRRIIDAAAASAAGRAHAESDVAPLHHAMQASLESVPVIVPYAPRLAEAIDENRVEARRAIGHVFGVIRASALLFQHQRERAQDGAVIACDLDYAIARRVLHSPLKRQLGRGVSDAAARLFERLSEKLGLETFTTTQVYESESFARGAVYGWLAELRSVGAVETVEASHGNKAAVLRVAKDDIDEVADILPPVSAVFGEHVNA